MTNNEQVMYIGPTLRGVAKSGAVFSDGIPKKLEKLAAKKPIIKNLIVPISGIVQAKKDVDTEGTVAAVAYDRISALSDAEVRKLTEGE